MCGDSWLATKDVQPTAPVPKAGHPGVLLFVVGLFSGCLIVCFVLARLFVWVGVFSFLFSRPSSWCAMHLYVHVFLRKIQLGSGSLGDHGVGVHRGV